MFAGLFTVILIGLVVENVTFRTVEPDRPPLGDAELMTRQRMRRQSEFMDEGAVARLAGSTTTLRQVARRSAGVAQERARRRRCAHRAQRTQVDRGLLAAAPVLKVVGRLGVGLDNIDVEACRERRIEVMPATGANALARPEYAIGAAMPLRGAYASSTAVANGEYAAPGVVQWPRSGRKTLGVVGFGGIGRPWAKSRTRARNAGDRIRFADRSVVGRMERRASFARGLDALLAEADVVTLHVLPSPQPGI